MFSRLVVSAAVAVTLLGAAACTRSENKAAKEALSQPNPPNPLDALSEEVLLSAKLADDEKLRDRVNRMSFAEVQRRLGSLELATEGKLAFVRGDLKVRSSEQVKITQAPEGDFAIHLETGDGGLQELVFANGVLFLKNNNGKWRASRDPVGERNELREDSAGIWRSFYDLYQHALTLKNEGTVTQAGRTAVKYRMLVANQEGEARAIAAKVKDAPPPPREVTDAGSGLGDAGVDVDPAEQAARVSARVRKWRERARPGGGTGTLVVDQATGVLLLVDFDGRLVVGDGPNPAELQVKVKHEVSGVGGKHAVTVPKDAIDEVVRKKWPVKPRKVLEDEGIVPPLPKEGEEAKAEGASK
jgi:hypothetical protein